LTDISAIDISTTDILFVEVAVTPKANNAPDDLRHLIPLTPAVFFILFALAQGEKHGYAIMQETSRLSEGSFEMGPGTLYTTIQRLLYLDAIAEAPGSGEFTEHESRRRYYRLTRAGRALLNAEVGRMKSVVRLAGRMKLALRTAE
jgi:DNA-binding PadR family transcriptional regulator